jgi:hypothetical protein
MVNFRQARPDSGPGFYVTSHSKLSKEQIEARSAVGVEIFRSVEGEGGVARRVVYHIRL